MAVVYYIKICTTKVVFSTNLSNIHNWNQFSNLEKLKSILWHIFEEHPSSLYINIYFYVNWYYGGKSTPPFSKAVYLCLIAKDQSFYTRFRLIYEVRVKAWSSNDERSCWVRSHLSVYQAVFSSLSNGLMIIR